jgi:hypothetical protein
MIQIFILDIKKFKLNIFAQATQGSFADDV